VDRYFLASGSEPEHEVTRDEYVRAERAAGFRNTLGQPAEPATAAFSSGSSRGRVSYARPSEQEIPMPRPLYPAVTVAEPDGDLARELLITRTASALAAAGVPDEDVRLFWASVESFTSYISVLMTARSWVTVLAPDQETPR